MTVDIFGGVPLREKKKFDIPEGTEIGTLYQIVDMGTTIKDGKDKSGNPQKYQEHNVRLSFELPDVTADFGKGVQEPAAIHDHFVRFEMTVGKTIKQNPKTSKTSVTLFGYATALDQQAKESINTGTFKFGDLLGKSCQLQLIRNGEYTNIAGAIALPKSAGQPKPVNPLFSYSIARDGFAGAKWDSLSEKTREALKKTEEYKEIMGIQDESFGM
jgi:hypothetical protein